MFQPLASLEPASRKRRHAQLVCDSVYDTVMQHDAGPGSSAFPEGLVCVVEDIYVNALKDAGLHHTLRLMEAMQGPY